MFGQSCGIFPLYGGGGTYVESLEKLQQVRGHRHIYIPGSRANAKRESLLFAWFALVCQVLICRSGFDLSLPSLLLRWVLCRNFQLLVRLRSIT